MENFLCSWGVHDTKTSGHHRTGRRNKKPQLKNKKRNVWRWDMQKEYGFSEQLLCASLGSQHSWPCSSGHRWPYRLRKSRGEISHVGKQGWWRKVFVTHRQSWELTTLLVIVLNYEPINLFCHQPFAGCQARHLGFSKEQGQSGILISHQCSI